ncbi:MAG: UDP-N-acetylglucosamine diphosphorylase/glucosamine-1-phosphate N-acetyltransferase [Nitrospirae bacterium]|nr:UDP-N-acetylglucosamine diphosphorylase/glucosamine-1-phosphate N-acetyltransferase [Nitrospirota bacterium]
MRNSRELSVIVLAAGLGTRMKSSVSKVLHKLNRRYMIDYVLDTVQKLKPDNTVIVAGRHNIKELKEIFPTCTVALQSRPLGTAHAVISGVKKIGNFQGDILVLNGDTPLVTPDTIRAFITRHRRAGNHLSIISFIAQNPTGYGRIIRDKRNRPLLIREERNATDAERAIREVNSGVYLFSKETVSLLKRIKKNPLKGEYYLTDILEIANKSGYRCGVYPIGQEEEFLGINTKDELLQAQRRLRLRVVRYWLDRDVSFIDEERVYISPDAVIGAGTTLYPDVVIEGNSRIGENCVIYPNVRITDSQIGDSVLIKDSTVVESSVIGSDVVVGPFARIRPGTEIKKSARIGNFVEIKASVIGEGTKAQHLSYIGDAEVGENVNVGAGTITCNYDGERKHKTIIDKEVFIGSDSQLIAPVRVGRGAYIGAGSTITDDVPAYSLALSRVRQRNIKGWVKRRKKKKKRC